MTTRANFLKLLMTGIAAAPVAASMKTHEHLEAPAESGKWKEKQWKSGGLHFSEYVFPITMPSHFEEIRSDRPMHRMITIPIFSREVVNQPVKDIISKMLETNSMRTKNAKRYNMPVVDENGQSIDYGSDEQVTNHITIVKVEGHPELMGIGLTEFKLTPVRDYYRDVAARNKRVKKGMSHLLHQDADSLPNHAQPLTAKEQVAHSSGRVGKTDIGGDGLRIL